MSGVKPVSEEAIRKVALRIMAEKGVNETTAFKRAQKWADGVNAKAFGPPAPRPPACPGPRCQCENCNANHARHLRARQYSASLSGPGCW